MCPNDFFRGGADAWTCASRSGVPPETERLCNSSSALTIAGISMAAGCPVSLLNETGQPAFVFQRQGKRCDVHRVMIPGRGMGGTRLPVMPPGEAPPVRGSSHFESVDLGAGAGAGGPGAPTPRPWGGWHAICSCAGRAQVFSRVRARRAPRAHREKERCLTPPLVTHVKQGSTTYAA